ncbi:MULTISPECIES: quinone-dependent dihydroorotate dehydrogenase [unclassified Paenibacillus]|uniref:quinone-dependent dihydroorotate dehydrogenase n=1 Tax=unclassified Paenibacillus TaxID=185978 RepID=UPI0009569E31|nr:MULTISPECIES: quinone-dependent dihydroorotate dehydrogenase [unclassified Paenibacillus]ASS64885.1 quinone-dependent dihydroorotate dehydrogenase [Paenibacillus sp. RUD330]SIR02685.1 dihydroorotate oxidase A [Paenibacillus sp. RU4X]SIR32575.1 dihydroorotate oxidase A [Paenibacillus sp. RU4T]
MLYQYVAKPFFFRLDPEKAHHLVIDGLHQASRVPGMTALLRGMYGVPEYPELSMDLLGLSFAHPVGLAAGLDKNAKSVEGFSSVGFGFMEVGTVTPLPQPGNELPRLFRLPADEALINRMGFNNDGAAAMAGRLGSLSARPIPVFVNIGKNKATPNELAHEDYRRCVKELFAYGDLFVVNISSPNTPDLRALQLGDELKTLLQAVKEEMAVQAAKHGSAPKPVLVKLAPDMTPEQLAFSVDTIAASGVEGIIATNTTLSRDGLTHANASQSGGMSGRPLRERSTEVVAAIYRQTGGKLPIIGSGGIFTAEDAYAKIRAGASLVEIYTSMIYKGPGIVKEIASGLRELLLRDGHSHLREAIGADHH